MTVKMRKDGKTGEVEIEGFGSELHFSEWHNGEGYDFAVSRGTNSEQKFDLTIEEIFSIAQMGLMTEAFSLRDLAAAGEYSKRYNLDREKTLAEIRENYNNRTRMPVDLEAAYDEAHRPLTDIYGDALGGGDGTPEYAHVEGWGIQNLDNGDFEITYKV